MSALENRVRQHYSKSEDHTDSDVEDIMEDVCSLIRSLFTTKKLYHLAFMHGCTK